MHVLSLSNCVNWHIWAVTGSASASNQNKFAFNCIGKNSSCESVCVSMCVFSVDAPGTVVSSVVFRAQKLAHVRAWVIWGDCESFYREMQGFVYWCDAEMVSSKLLLIGVKLNGVFSYLYDIFSCLLGSTQKRKELNFYYSVTWCPRTVHRVQEDILPELLF